MRFSIVLTLLILIACGGVASAAIPALNGTISGC